MESTSSDLTVYCPRSPSSTSPHSTSPQSTNPQVLTYRFEKSMVYVTPAEDYEKAVDYAQQVFPKLATVDRERISFSVSVCVEGKKQTVRVSSMAWKTVAWSLAKYEIIEISVEPLSESADLPPAYFGDDSRYSDKKFLEPDSAIQNGRPRSRSSSRPHSPSSSTKKWIEKLF
ncbi:hypothetical protein JAAARDRAFT_60102 [Jaapia argillacea MUCL 33604]|uniref:Uncharacterized protein n=1 Tax=Jaapia argillacea MUCL 33604 TaxID=933084 RepID=A0A067PXS4_9AGAM|nr:hypothetical protein JAAARDRAFT_60102 [Jaapia argillacea MUCL 33604]